ncbi:hypothetical protein DBR06_SOUSAS510176, partial [Sousa chinensis]
IYARLRQCLSDGRDSGNSTSRLSAPRTMTQQKSPQQQLLELLSFPPKSDISKDRKESLRPGPVRIPHNTGANLCGSSEAANISGRFEFNYKNFPEKIKEKF